MAQNCVAGLNTIIDCAVNAYYGDWRIVMPGETHNGGTNVICLFAVITNDLDLQCTDLQYIGGVTKGAAHVPSTARSTLFAPIK